jgi:hypothetical protein
LYCKFVFSSLFIADGVIPLEFTAEDFEPAKRTCFRIGFVPESKDLVQRMKESMTWLQFQCATVCRIFLNKDLDQINPSLKSHFYSQVLLLAVDVDYDEEENVKPFAMDVPSPGGRGRLIHSLSMAKSEELRTIIVKLLAHELSCCWEFTELYERNVNDDYAANHLMLFLTKCYHLARQKLSTLNDIMMPDCAYNMVNLVKTVLAYAYLDPNLVVLKDTDEHPLLQQYRPEPITLDPISRAVTRGSIQHMEMLMSMIMKLLKMCGDEVELMPTALLLSNINEMIQEKFESERDLPLPPKQRDVGFTKVGEDLYHLQLI